MEAKKCLFCGIEFLPQRSSSKYCGRLCQAKHIGALHGKTRSEKRKNGKIFSCLVCSGEFYAPKYRMETAKYCSRRCTSLANPDNTKKAQEASPIMKRSGQVQPKKYVVITVDGKQIREHRHVMQVHLGRRLLPNEHVHHINGDPTDNRVENLMVLTNSEHQKLELSLVSSSHQQSAKQ